jgi:hypothetical protein
LRAASLAQDASAEPPPISRSAFNRTAITIATHGSRLTETHEIAAVLAPKLDQAGDNSVTLMVAETIAYFRNAVEFRSTDGRWRHRRNVDDDCARSPLPGRPGRFPT